MGHKIVLILAVYCSRRVCRDFKLCTNSPITGWLRI